MAKIVLEKAYLGTEKISRAYLGDVLLYDDVANNRVFYMSAYNNAAPEVNTFGAIQFDGGTDIDGWIGYDPAGKSTQSMTVTPHLSSLGCNFFMMFDAQWVIGSNGIELQMQSIKAVSDKLTDKGDQLDLRLLLGKNTSNNKNEVSYYSNHTLLLNVVLDRRDNLFQLGAYIDAESHKCYLGYIYMFHGTIHLEELQYIDYDSIIYFYFSISTFGNVTPMVQYKNLAVWNVRDMVISKDSGVINYL